MRNGCAPTEEQVVSTGQSANLFMTDGAACANHLRGQKMQPSGACAIRKSGGRHRQTAQVGQETVGWKVADAGSKSENKEARKGIKSL